MGRTISFEISDGDAPAGRRRYTHITGGDHANNHIPTPVSHDGETLSFEAFGTLLGVQEDWGFTVSCWGCKSFLWTFTNLKSDKVIEDSLVLKPAAAPMPVAPMPVAPAVGLTAPAPTPAPAPTRLLGYYREDGVGVGGVPFTAGAESGFTDSSGALYVNSPDRVAVSVSGQSFDGLDDGDETFVLDVSSA